VAIEIYWIAIAMRRRSSGLMSWSLSSCGVGVKLDTMNSAGKDVVLGAIVVTDGSGALHIRSGRASSNAGESRTAPPTFPAVVGGSHRLDDAPLKGDDDDRRQ
jgi:hypothetical protein